MEQGKDIITIAPDGECCAYQTKTGDIGLAAWRNISGEIQELVELPMDYPGVDKSRIHRAYLVTNGSIKDPVRVQITGRNEDNERKNRQYAHLEVIGQDSLLKSFVDAQGHFVPRELPDMRRGRNPVPSTQSRAAWYPSAISSIHMKRHRITPPWPKAGLSWY